jgi:hypothetical protein
MEERRSDRRTAQITDGRKPQTLQVTSQLSDAFEFLARLHKALSHLMDNAMISLCTTLTDTLSMHPAAGLSFSALFANLKILFII